MKKTYQDLCADNRYLFEKAEDCTLMLGLALLKGQEHLYTEYKALRTEILAQVEINLDLIEDIWNTPVDVREAIKTPSKTAPAKIRNIGGKRIIELYEECNYYSPAFIASESKTTVADVEKEIYKYKNRIRTNPETV